MNIIKFLFLFLGAFYFTACQDTTTHNEAGASETTTTAPATTAVYKRVANEHFKKLMAEMPDAQLVDVRTPEEYANGHIGKAQNIDYTSDDFKNKIATLDKSKPVLVYCQAGGRSKKACNVMEGLGFQEIYELETGFGGWAE